MPQLKPNRLIEALKPFADFARASGFEKLPRELPMTKGSQLAHHQVRAKAFTEAREAYDEAVQDHNTKQPTNPTIERVARAIYETDNQLMEEDKLNPFMDNPFLELPSRLDWDDPRVSDHTRKGFRRIAQAALEAMKGHCPCST